MKNEELMKKHAQMVGFTRDMISKLESDIKRIKFILNKLEKFDPENENSLDMDEELRPITNDGAKSYEEGDIQVIEGIFDGYFMIGPELKKYPVPMNYSSKTKLVAGDKLKLKILEDGKFIYKLIHPVERKYLKGTLSLDEEGKTIVVADEGGIFFVNQAAVNFFKGNAGDKVYILTNGKEEYDYAAIEAIIKE